MSSPDTGSPLDALAPDVSAGVQASAGSGKTWLLVSRIVRLLLAGASPGGIVALTFTRKAAAEMRQRLSQRLLLLARASGPELDAELARIGAPLDPETRARARRLHRELLFAPFAPRAMTLDAFAQDLLGRFALEAGLEPGFTLLEAEEELTDRVWRRLQLALREEPDGEAARALAQLVALGQGESALREIVAGFIARRSDWRALVAGHDGPVAYAAGLLAEALGHPDESRALQVLDGDLFNMRLKMFVGLLEQAGGVGSVKAERVAPALDLAGEARLAALRLALLTEGGEGAPYKFEPRKTLTPALRGSLSENHAEVLRPLEAAIDQQRRARTLAGSTAAMTLGHAALDALAIELGNTHSLGFPELEWHAFRLLREADAADWIRYKLDCRIDHLLLDEFQDTSPTQWRMLLPVLEEMASGNAPGDGGRARSLFVVGDPKQSIYGFRRADPGLLDRATGWMREHLGAITRPLHASRRSAQPVIDFVNALFAGDAGLPLRFVPHATHRGGDWGCVEVAPLIERVTGDDADAEPFRDPLTTPRPQREERRAAQEAQQVVTRIRQLVGSGIAICGEHGESRGLGYGDVMVLARARTHLRALERELSAARIPFVGAARGTLLQTSEAQDLIAVLRQLEAPHRNLELARALRSPLFGAGDEALAALAQESRRGDGVWRSALARLADSSPELRRAHRLLEGWQGLAGRLPAHDLIDRVLHDSDAAARYEAALPEATRGRARANLATLQQLALTADSGRYPSLPRFLRFLEVRARAELDAPDEAPPPALAGHLRIMTVHAAKGLEAPAVFVVNAGSGGSGAGPRLLVDWPTEAERPRLLALAGAKDPLTAQLIAAARARGQAEDLNLLYVAMTRARQFLHVSGFRSRNTDSWHERAWNALERLGAVAAPGAARVHANGAPPPAPARPPPAPMPPVDPRLRLKLPLPAVPRPARASGPRGADTAATRRGTALHRLLQALTDGVAGESLQAELEPLLERGGFAALLAAARAVLAEPALARFFDAEKFRKAWNEVPLTTAAGAAVIDRLVDDGDALWVLDYKSGADGDAAQLAERHGAQLRAYAEGVRAIWPGRRVRAGVILTGSRRWVELG